MTPWSGSSMYEFGLSMATIRAIVACGEAVALTPDLDSEHTQAKIKHWRAILVHEIETVRQRLAAWEPEGYPQ